VGISASALRILAEAKIDYPQLGGSLLQLGRQWKFFSDEESSRILRGFPQFEPTGVAGEFVDESGVFQALGFNAVESLDFSNFEGATHVFDLNRPVPGRLINKYDTILDAGTIEHVFDIRQSFENIHKMLKVGGSIIHIAPSSNHVDHGFYMFSPTLFLDYYSANNYEIKKIFLLEYNRHPHIDPWVIYDYWPGRFEHLSIGGWVGGKVLGVFLHAVKTQESTGDAVPQQGLYRRAWPETADPPPPRRATIG
jgi:SAM-dependent methyltransferase